MIVTEVISYVCEESLAPNAKLELKPDCIHMERSSKLVTEVFFVISVWRFPMSGVRVTACISSSAAIVLWSSVLSSA